MATDKRQRQKQGRQDRLEAERAALARTRRNRGIRNAVVFAAVVVIAAIVLSRTGKKDDNSSESVKTDRSTSSTTSPTAKSVSADACPPTTGSTKRIITFEGALKDCLKSGSTYRAVVTTSQGTVEVALDTKRTPKTTNAFVSLARWKYYDGTKMFRTEKASGIIQGGSPHTQDNTDRGPGFPIADEGGTFSSADYGPGTLAMARTKQPDSANGQFFFLSGEGARYLGDTNKTGAAAGSYVVFGKATKGLDVLKKISSLDDGSGKPASSKRVAITKVQITEQ